MSARRFVAGLVSAVALLGACGQAATPAGSDGRPVADCEALAEEAADLLVVLADHAAADGGGLPPSALQAEHPEDLGPWELAAALADGSHDLQTRVASAEDAADRLGCRRGRLHDTIDTRIDDELSRRGSQLSDEFDREQYTAMNLLALVSAAFQPSASPAAGLPSGFPAAFPVHPDAERVDADAQRDGSVTATWQVDGDFEAVADFYLDALQELRFGGWNVGHSQSSQTENARGGSTGHRRLEITGYGRAGEVEVTSDHPGRVTVTARLTPQK